MFWECIGINIQASKDYPGEENVCVYCVSGILHIRVVKSSVLLPLVSLPLVHTLRSWNRVCVPSTAWKILEFFPCKIIVWGRWGHFKFLREVRVSERPQVTELDRTDLLLGWGSPGLNRSLLCLVWGCLGVLDKMPSWVGLVWSSTGLFLHGAPPWLKVALAWSRFPGLWTVAVVVGGIYLLGSCFLSV